MNRKARYSHIVCGIESFKIPAMFFGFCALEIEAKEKKKSLSVVSNLHTTEKVSGS